MAIQKDWNYIEELFRSGFSYRQICKKYIETFPDEKLWPETVRKRAIKHKWTRDLKPKIKKAVDRKLMEKTGGDVSAREGKPPRTDDEIVDDVSEAQVELILAHRVAGQKIRSAVSDLVATIAANPKTIIMRTDKKTGQVTEIEVPMPVKDVARTLKDLAFAMGRTVDIERVAHNLNDKLTLGQGTIDLHLSVPDADPLPDEI